MLPKSLLQVQLDSPYGRITLKSRSSTSHVFIQFLAVERLPGAQPPAGPPKFKLHVTFIGRSDFFCHRGHFKQPISHQIMHSQSHTGGNSSQCYFQYEKNIPTTNEFRDFEKLLHKGTNCHQKVCSKLS